MQRTVLSTAALLLIAACQPHEVYESPSQARYLSTPMPPAPTRPTRLEGAVAAAQPAEPPANVMLVREGNLVGRAINDRIGQGLVYVQYVLVDPTSGEPRYAVASSENFGGYVMVPVSTVYDTGTGIAVQTSAHEIELMPRYSLAQVEWRWPQRSVHGVSPYVYGLPPAPRLRTGFAPLRSADQALEPLHLVRDGSVVGMQVVDSFGRPVGQVDAVAAIPATGEVRYAIVASRSLSAGSYIAVPALSARLADGRVVLNGSATNWSAAPHYRAEQIQQYYGSLGMAN